MPAETAGTLLAQLVLVIAVILLDILVNIGEDAKQALLSAAAGVPPAAALWAHKRRLPVLQRLTEAATGAPLKNPLLVAMAFGALLALVESLVGGLLGAVVGYTAGLAGRTDIMGPAMVGVSPIVLLLLLIASVTLSAKISHYLPRKPTRWLLVVVATYLALRVATLMVSSGSLRAAGLDLVPSLIALDLLVIAFLVFVSLLAGAAIARRRHPTFMVTWYFRQLMPEDRATAIEIIRDTAVSQAASHTMTATRRPE